jgi:uncharacterized membrane protein YhdT
VKGKTMSNEPVGNGKSGEPNPVHDWAAILFVSTWFLLFFAEMGGFSNWKHVLPYWWKMVGFLIVFPMVYCVIVFALSRFIVTPKDSDRKNADDPDD